MDILTILFIVLRLYGVIDWPWVWVLSPTWITLLTVVIVKVIFRITRIK